MEDQQAAKHQSLLTNLASYLEICAGNKNPDIGLQSLQHYCKKFPQFKLSIELYNIVMGGFAEKANLPKVKEVLRMLKKDKIQRNFQSYAFAIECIGRLGDSEDNLRLLKELHDDALKNVNWFVMLES